MNAYFTKWIATAVLGICLSAVARAQTEPPVSQEVIMPDLSFQKGGQEGIYSDENMSAGVFHFYEKFQLAKTKDEPRRIDIFLPRDYDEAQAFRYPVIYMNDGHTAFHPGGLGNKSINLHLALAQLYRTETFPKVIVVAIYPNNRDKEYTHESVLNRSCCGLPQYASYLANTVKPWIDANYRTNPDARYTMIAGSSHGGLAAFYIATRYPQRFGNILGQSSSFWVGPDTSVLQTFNDMNKSSLMQGAEKTLENPALRPRIYLDWGMVRSGGFHNQWIEAHATSRSKEVVALLKTKYGYRLNENLLSVEDSKGEHSEDSWAQRLPAALEFLFR